MGGDAHLEALIDSIARITEVQTDSNGSRVWLAEALADDLLPIVASQGPAAGLAGAGAADTGLAVTVEIRQSSDGYLEGFSMDMSEWWTEAISLVEPSAGDLSSQVDFTLTSFDAPLALEQPCQEPSTDTTTEGLTGFICVP